MNNLLSLARLAWDELVDMFPWFLLAVLLGIAVRLLALDVVARRVFRKHGLLAVIGTAAIGALSPFCSFTVIPLIRKFLQVGVPLSAVMAFWIASPSMSPEIFAITASQLGVPFALTRLLGALAFSTGAGLIVMALERRGRLRNPLRENTTTAKQVPTCYSSAVEAEQATAVASGAARGANPTSTVAVEVPVSACAAAAASSGCDAASSAEDDGRPWWPQAKEELRSIKLRGLLKEIWTDTFTLGRWLLLAVVFEALILQYVPREAVANTIGASGVLAVPLAAVLSVPLYLNGISAIPIVAGLVAKGMLPAAGITFMLAGSVTTIPAIVAVRSVVRNGIFFLYLAVSVGGALVVGALSALWL